MLKKIINISSLALVLFLLLGFTTPVFALSSGTDPKFAIDVTDISPKADGTTSRQIKNAGNQIIGIIQVVGTIVAVVMLVYIGIKYLIASPNEKAEIKHTAFIYVVAAVILFAAVNILAIVQNFATGIFSDSGIF